MVTLTTESEDTRIYEIAVLIPYPLNQKEEQDIIKSIEAILKETGGKEVGKDAWGSRGLAYNIGGYGEGNIIVYHYEMDPSKVKEMDEALRISQGVLRHLVVKPPKGYEIVNYSEKYQEWLKNRVHEEEQAERDKEDALKKRVIERAKRQGKVDAKKDDAAAEAPAMKEGELDEKLEELISDDDLDI